MMLCAHPTTPSNLTPKHAFEFDTGILCASSLSDRTLTIQYWITTRFILPTFTQDFQEAGYDVLYFTPFSSESVWTHLYPKQAILNIIYVRLNEMNPPSFPSLASLMSTSLATTTPPTHNYPSNETVDPATTLIALMHQSLQQNSSMMTQLNYLVYTTIPTTIDVVSIQTSAPPFPKWDGTPPTTPLLLAQMVTYKAKAFYAGKHHLTRTTPVSRQLSVKINFNMLVSHLSLISSIFLNDAKFGSNGIAKLYLLLTHLNPSSKKKPLLAISDLTCLEMQLGKLSIDYVSRVQGISQRMQGVAIERIIPLFAITIHDDDL